MVDEVDQTESRSEFYHKMNLAKSKRPSGPQATGACLFCEEPVEDDRRWCSPECRDDWEKDNQ